MLTKINLKYYKNPATDGFALLMTLIVVGVVLSIGLSLYDLSIKQIRLSTTAKDSEIAFHAANAGVECARYVRHVNTAEMEDGDNINPTCFGQAVDGAVTNQDPVADNDLSLINGAGETRFYSYQFTWGGDTAFRCTRIQTLIIKSDPNDPDATELTDMKNLFAGFPTDNTICEPGSVCTIIATKGYNKPCSGINNYGVVEREVLLEY